MPKNLRLLWDCHFSIVVAVFAVGQTIVAGIVVGHRCTDFHIYLLRLASEKHRSMHLQVLPV